jgi:hypothetical protein
LTAVTDGPTEQRFSVPAEPVFEADRAAGLACPPELVTGWVARCSRIGAHLVLNAADSALTPCRSRVPRTPWQIYRSLT